MYKLKKFGSFFVGGRKVKITEETPYKVKRGSDSNEMTIDPNGEFIIESAYVQFFIPENTNDAAILFIHGGGQTGAVWESIPGNTEGWLHYFLRKGYSSYIIDTVERGRAGWCSHKKYLGRSARTKILKIFMGEWTNRLSG